MTVGLADKPSLAADDVLPNPNTTTADVTQSKVVVSLTSQVLRPIAAHPPPCELFALTSATSGNCVSIQRKDRLNRFCSVLIWILVRYIENSMHWNSLYRGFSLTLTSLMKFHDFGKDCCIEKNCYIEIPPVIPDETFLSKRANPLTISGYTCALMTSSIPGYRCLQIIASR